MSMGFAAGVVGTAVPRVSLDEAEAHGDVADFAFSCDGADLH